MLERKTFSVEKGKQWWENSLWIGKGIGKPSEWLAGDPRRFSVIKKIGIFTV